MKRIFTRFMVLLVCASLFFSDASAAISAPSPVSTTPANEPDAATVKSAIADFRSLSRKERRMRVKEAGKAIKEFKAQKRAGHAPVASKVLQVIFAILIPPLGVYLHDGEINSHFWIDLLLTLLFFLPGMIYALVIVLGDK